ncbi:hypothetical protein EV360DRAFT_87502, partial [Lentinula raphanica]
MTNRQLKLAQNAQKAVNRMSSEPADDVGWKHPDELIYSTGSYWTNKKLIHYCIANALSVHPHPDFKDLCFVSDGKKTVIVSDKYRIPIIFASQWQWSKLKGILSAEGKEGKTKWSDEKFEVLHIARVWKILTDEGPSSFELEYYDKEQKSEDIKAWRCPTLDRVLTRFRMGCFSSEPLRVEKFWAEYQESEYSKDVLDFDWRRWLLAARDGVVLYEASSKGLNPEVLMRGLVERDGAWFWPKDSDSTPAGTPAWSLRQTAGDLFARPTKKPSTEVLHVSKPDSARKVRSSISAPNNKSSSSLAASVVSTSTLSNVPSTSASVPTSSSQTSSLSTRTRRRRPRDSWNPPSDPQPTPSLRQVKRPSVANDDAASATPKLNAISQSPDATPARKATPDTSSSSLNVVASGSTLTDVASTSASTSSSQKPSPSTEGKQLVRYTPYPTTNPYRKPQPTPPLRKSTRPSNIKGIVASMKLKPISASESVNATPEREAIPSMKRPITSSDQVQKSAKVLETVKSQSSPVPSQGQTHKSSPAQPLASTPASTPVSHGTPSLQSK